MAFGGSNVIASDLDTSGFVPILWADEIMAAHKANLVLANLVRKINVKGKRGDMVVLPKPSRGAAVVKAANTIVTTLVASGGASVQVALTAHWEYSRLIEDIAETQALSSMRRFYTDDAGYALAKAKDTVLFQAARTLNGGDGTNAWNKAVIAGDGTTAFVDASGNANSTAITDAGIRRAMQVLDDSDIPMTMRSLVVPPVGRRILMGLARFSEQAFTGEMARANVIRTGRLGDVYGTEVYVSTNCPTPSAGTTVRIGLMFQKDAIVLANVLGPRVQTQYKQEYLATLLTADTIFGAAEAYDAGGLALAMPSA